MYSKNLEIMRFNKINLKNNVNIDENLFFKFIEYNSDIIAFYDKKEMHDIYSKIESLDKIGVINDLKISYSLPNQVFVYIDENKPIFMIKTDINQFIIDDKGKIFDSTLISDLLPALNAAALRSLIKLIFSKDILTSFS